MSGWVWVFRENVKDQYEIQMRCQLLTAVERAFNVGATNPRTCSLPHPALPARLQQSCLRLIPSIQDADGIDLRPGNEPPRLHRERRPRSLQVPRLPTVRSPNPRQHYHRRCPRYSPSRRTKGSRYFLRRPAPHHPQSCLRLEAESGHYHRA
jgi:hypothetical protein